MQLDSAPYFKLLIQKRFASRPEKNKKNNMVSQTFATAFPRNAKTVNYGCFLLLLFFFVFFLLRSQQEKNFYCICIHTYNIFKNIKA